MPEAWKLVAPQQQAAQNGEDGQQQQVKSRRRTGLRRASGLRRPAPASARYRASFMSAGERLRIGPFLKNSCGKQRDIDFVVARNGVAAAAAGGGPLDHILQGPVVLGHVEVGRSESATWWPRFCAMERALRKTSGMITAEPTFSQTPPLRSATTAGQQAEVAGRHLAGDGAVEFRVLVDDVGADRHMHRDRNVPARRRSPAGCTP